MDTFKGLKSFTNIELEFRLKKVTRTETIRKKSKLSDLTRYATTH